ncbi:hypothetical protein F5B18DRAFT_641143 [Nemania serpens]|nr:hypothetical protein F5B18DRAFT_641143 [Nemania serpens]
MSGWRWDTLTSPTSAHFTPRIKKCYCLPGKSCWPTHEQWANLSATLRGGLIKSYPLGSACHEPQYNVTLCTETREAREWPEIH